MSSSAELELPGGERVPLAGEVVLGRGTNVTIPIDDGEVSRRHAAVRAEGPAWVVEDLGSRNGTFLNGGRVEQPTPLQDQDVILIGKTSVVFRAGAAETALSPSPAQDAWDRTVVMPTDGPMPAFVPDSPVANVTEPHASPASMPAEPPPPIPPPPPPPAQAAPPAPVVRPAGAAHSPLQVLTRVSRRLLGLQDARQLADVAVSAILEEFGVEGASLLLEDPDSGHLYFASVAPGSVDSLRLIRLHPGEGVAGAVFDQKQPILASNVAEEPRHAAHVDAATGFATRSLVAAPVIAADGRALGVLEAVNPLDRPAFDHNDLDLITLVAQQLGLALGAARSWEALDRERGVLARVAAIREEFTARAPETLRLVMDAVSLHGAGEPVYLWGEPGSGRHVLARLVAESGLAGVELQEVDCAAAVVDSAAVLANAAERPVYFRQVTALPVAEQHRLAEALSARDQGLPGVFASGDLPLSSELGRGRLAPALLAVLEPGQLAVPPLRRRTAEIREIASRLVARYCERYGRAPLTLAADAVALLEGYGWPRNVTELEEVVRRAVIMARLPVIDAALLVSVAPELAGHEPAHARSGQPTAWERRQAELREHAREGLLDSDPRRRLDAIALIEAEKGAGFADALATALSDPAGSVRVRAAEVLSATAGADCLPPLFGALIREREPAIQCRMLDLIGEHGGEGAVEVASAWIQSADASLRRSAMRALRLAGSPAQEQVARAATVDPDPAVRAEAFAALVDWGLGDIGPLLDMAADGQPAEQAAACEALGDLDDGSPTVVAALSDPDPAVRAAAARALALSPNPAATEPLLALLNDPAVQVHAAIALAAAHPPGALAPLGEIVADESRPVPLRRAAIAGIGAIGDRRATPLLIACLGDPAVSGAAIEALGKLGDAEAEPAVLAHLEAGMDEERAAAIKALGRCGSVAAIRPLLRLAMAGTHLDRPAMSAALDLARRAEPDALAQAVDAAVADEVSRVAAFHLAGQLGDPRLAPVLLARAGEAPEAIEALMRLRGGGIDALLHTARTNAALGPALEAALGDMAAQSPGEVLRLLTDDSLGPVAAKALTGAGDRALADLVLAAETEHDPLLLGRLLQLVGRLGRGRFAAFLARFLDHENGYVRRAAIVALGDAEGEAAERALLAQAAGSDPVSAAYAIAALGRMGSAEAFDRFLDAVATAEDSRVQYALAAAIGSYNLRQPAVGAAVAGMIRDGRPFTARALAAVLESGALTTADLLSVLATSSDPFQSRVFRATSALPPRLALEILDGAVAVARGRARVTLGEALATIGAPAAPTVARLLLDAGARDIGIEALRRLSGADATAEVLRRTGAAIGRDPALAASLGELGAELVGRLVDGMYHAWDADALRLAWQVASLATPDSPGAGKEP